MSFPVRLSEFLPYVLPNAPGAPEVVAEKYVRMAAIEFCERTRCWRKISTVTLDDRNTVGLVAPFYATIHAIEYASFSSDSVAKTPLTPTQYSDLADRHRSDLNGEGTPQYITQVNPNSVTVMPLAAGELEVSLFLKPRMGQSFDQGTDDDPIQDSFNLAPDFLLTQWGEAIACGALSKLLMQPQTRWHNPEQAVYYLSKFERACDHHFSSNIIGQQRAPRRSRFRFV